ncbi:MAG: phytanoyl-CoA dioxygenase family protein [Burkholderiaceae bacterium]|nr:phytanoyl-CoA dioxygenase family protein [Burkholderiaceae bacterium]
MTTASNPVPAESYGVLVQDSPASDLDEVAEQVRRIGYAILDSGYSTDYLSQLSEAFNRIRMAYVQNYGEARLRKANELYTIRAPLVQGDNAFVRLATNQNLLSVLGKLIKGKFILNQQNGVINPPDQTYNQGAWHRDLPYQHYVSNTPLAVNALFCVDDFTIENGSTFVLPATHREVNYPSDSYIQRNALQIEAKAGQYILLDCMLFHSGGFNRTDNERRAVNHVYTIPYFKQQIKLPDLLLQVDLDQAQKELFGFNFQEPTSIDHYLNDRVR